MSNLGSKFHALSLHWANTNKGIWVLFLCAFADASFFPLPITTLFIILVLLNTSEAYKYALFNVLGTLAGALAGYLIGHFAWHNANGGFTGFAHFLFNNVPGISEGLYNHIHVLFLKWNFGILLFAACTPLPLNLFSVSSGVFEINIFIFFLATLISQGIKFMLLAYLTIKLGPEIKKLLNFNWRPLAIIGMVCIAIVILVTKAI